MINKAIIKKGNYVEITIGHGQLGHGTIIKVLKNSFILKMSYFNQTILLSELENIKICADES